jgi:hypothetical protein
MKAEWKEVPNKMREGRKGQNKMRRKSGAAYEKTLVHIYFCLIAATEPLLEGFFLMALLQRPNLLCNKKKMLQRPNLLCNIQHTHAFVCVYIYIHM